MITPSHEKYRCLKCQRVYRVPYGAIGRNSAVVCGVCRQVAVAIHPRGVAIYGSLTLYERGYPYHGGIAQIAFPN